MPHFYPTPLLLGEARENLFLITQPKTWHKQRPQHSDRDVDADTPIGWLYSRSERECTRLEMRLALHTRTVECCCSRRDQTPPAQAQASAPTAAATPLTLLTWLTEHCKIMT